MANTSATGGYLLPTSTEGFPGGLTFDQFIHNVLAGVSGVDKLLIRPKWQPMPPKQPERTINWIAYGWTVLYQDSRPFIGLNEGGQTYFQRQENYEINLSVYGADGALIASIIRDGFQIQQNTEELRSANMGFNSVSEARHIPDLIQGNFVNRIEFTIYLSRQVKRLYDILPLAGASGTIEADNTSGGEYETDWRAPEEE